ncbi:hypothetical protein C9J85_01345 [Haloferax sp. wsp5]|nr:hypothetical protein C9J85_01345 [Haloferax sp. wsp5]
MHREQTPVGRSARAARGSLHARLHRLGSKHSCRTLRLFETASLGIRPIRPRVNPQRDCSPSSRRPLHRR